MFKCKLNQTQEPAMTQYYCKYGGSCSCLALTIGISFFLVSFHLFFSAIMAAHARASYGISIHVYTHIQLTFEQDLRRPYAIDLTHTHSSVVQTLHTHTQQCSVDLTHTHSSTANIRTRLAQTLRVMAQLEKNQKKKRKTHTRHYSRSWHSYRHDERAEDPLRRPYEHLSRNANQGRSRVVCSGSLLTLTQVSFDTYADQGRSRVVFALYIYG